MDQKERRLFLIRGLLREREDGSTIGIPDTEEGQRRLLRSLMNVRPPGEMDGEFLEVQDAYLQERIREDGITDISDLNPLEEGIYLWKGDITRLRCDAIVNAANSGMTGCYVPCHTCIDNCIHTFAGIQLRRDCGRIMRRQGYDEPTGSAKITKAYNLPSRYVLHTVGPIVSGRLTETARNQLADCYRSCLAVAAENGVRSVAFCCISTGVFGFPRLPAAEIAVDTVRKHRGSIEVIFNVFSDEDDQIYRSLLGTDKKNR
ncbi:MAG: protein-ADP-ribose hydrolase [Clostridia bacterium]|nr:protein-ADP-ribose hydrolase [Clostridia bacterium]MBR0444364.1 protein-ADP-ribose hydrolase [Clostridia bacterium]